MTERSIILVPIFLGAQALLVPWVASKEQPPPLPDFSHFNTQLGPWERVSESADEATKAQLGADRLMNSMYMQQPNGELANLFVAWFQSQRAGTSQPHSPQVCLPASGWVPESSGLIDIQTGAGKITVNRYVIAKGYERAVVLYWYQTPRRVVAGEWAAKFWLMSDAVRDKRTDTALVRITTWANNNGDVSVATKVAVDYSQRVYPLLRETFPK
jgi:EpsI family protein